MTDLPEFPRWVSVRDPNTNQRWKPAVARLRDGTLIVWAQVGREVQRVLTVPVSAGAQDGQGLRLEDEAGTVWQVEAAKCGCGSGRALKGFDPDVVDP